MQKELGFNVLGNNLDIPIIENKTLGEKQRYINISLARQMLRNPNFDALSYRLLRTRLLQILNLKNYDEVPSLFPDDEKKRELNEVFTKKEAQKYGLGGLEYPVQENLVKGALRVADRVIDMFENAENGFFKEYHTQLQITNEIKQIDNVVDLVLIMFSPRATEITQYEARRKLVLADLAMRVLTHNRQKEKHLDPFLRFLNTNIFKDVIGTSNEWEVLSTHHPDDYSVTTVKKLLANEKVTIDEKTLQRYSRFGVRSFKYGQINIETYLESREKDPRDIVIKMLRKQISDPAKIDDHIGARLVFENKRGLYHFLDVLQSALEKEGSAISFDEISDTINNHCQFPITNDGSSANLAIVKAHAVFNGMKVEFQLHTLGSFLDCRYHDETGFESSYSVNRLYQSGVIDTLYPENIYRLNTGSVVKKIIELRRSQIRNTGLVSLPEKRKN